MNTHRMCLNHRLRQIQQPNSGSQNQWKQNRRKKTTYEGKRTYESEHQPYQPSYTYKEETPSAAPKVIGIIVLLLLIGGAVWYFAFYRPKQLAKKEKERKEILAIQEEARRKEDERLAAAKRAEEEAKKAADSGNGNAGGRNN